MAFEAIEQPSKRQVHRLQGEKNQASGKRFEDMIEVACSYYAAEGVAIFEKTPEPFRVTKSLDGGRFLGHFAKQAQPDYKGVLRGGRCIAFEAKHTDADQIAQNRVNAEQYRQLEQYHAFGAICFVIVSLGFLDFYRVPWKVWRDMKAICGRKHMKHADLEAYRLPCVQGVIRILDFLKV